MNSSTRKWIFLKYSSAVLIPLMIWFIMNFVSIYDLEYSELISSISNTQFKLFFSLFIIFAFFFSSLTINEIFEDYIHNEKIKNVANKGLYFFAIIIPLLTIIIMFSLIL